MFLSSSKTRIEKYYLYKCCGIRYNLGLLCGFQTINTFCFRFSKRPEYNSVVCCVCKREMSFPLHHIIANNNNKKVASYKKIQL